MKERLRYIWRAHKYRRRHDRQELDAVMDRLQPGDLAIDIGAHKGAYTYWISRSVGKEGAVVSFEPQPELASYLKRAIPAASLKNVTLEHMALSDEVGEGTIVLPEDADGKPSPGARLGASEDGVKVQLTTLDDYFANHSARPVRFIKCDVEGHELAVFKGGQRLLSEDHPAILFECEERHREGPVTEVFEYLISLGYVGYFFSPDGLRPLGEFDATLHQSADPRSEDYLNNFLFESAGA